MVRKIHQIDYSPIDITDSFILYIVHNIQNIENKHYYSEYMAYVRGNYHNTNIVQLDFQLRIVEE